MIISEGNPDLFHDLSYFFKKEPLELVAKEANLDIEGLRYKVVKAFKEAIVNFNPGLFSTDDQLEVCYLYLAAHYLVNDIQTAQQGVNSTGYAPVNSRSVGSVSESYTLPDWMAQDPYLSNFTTTRYGQKYLSMIKPLLIGNVQVYQGWTTFE